MKKNSLNGFACITSELEVGRFQHSAKFKYLILESDPLPRYYADSDIPDGEFHIGDHHFYLLIKNPLSCFQDVVLRHAIAIKEKHKLNLHIFPGQMTYQNKIHPCIRINTPETAQIEPVIKELIKVGIKFVNDTKVKPYLSRIQYKRYIEFVTLDSGIYQDSTNLYRFFIKMPGDIEFDRFQEIIKRIKNNCDFHLFDAFLTYLFYGDSILDFAGVYSTHCDQNRFVEFKTELEKEFAQTFNH